MLNAAMLNAARYVPGQRAGHYESFYQRANHPTRPLAFWLRYTIFSPDDRPQDAVGELWAVVFDGETGDHAVAKAEYPIAGCSFDRERFAVSVGGSVLGPDALRGKAGPIEWELSYAGDQPPLYLLPARMYDGGFPKAKSLVAMPLARYDGRVLVGDKEIEVDGWLGSQNHNWGSRHTDQYAFGQVAGFDGVPDSFLEVTTARAKIGPLWTPFLTLLVLRHHGREYSLVSLRQALRAQARFGFFFWDFASSAGGVRIAGHIAAARSAFVGLRYPNPPGGFKDCLNTKIASCELMVVDKASGEREVLRAQHRTLFEILTDDHRHGVPISA
jgi:hypothetical protein